MSAEKGWNPLLGQPPTSLYAALEALAKEKGEPHRLIPAQVGVKFNRWPFYHHGDKLVHALLPLHNTQFWQCTPNGFAPVEAITECGVLALLKSTQHTTIPQYDSGAIAPNNHLTCIRCASGIDGEGVRYRQAQKNRNFGAMYGMDMSKSSKLMNTNRPNMQQMPRGPSKPRKR
jgi:hypothetical protein